MCPAFAGQSLESRLAAQRSVLRAHQDPSVGLLTRPLTGRRKDVRHYSEGQENTNSCCAAHLWDSRLAESRHKAYQESQLANIAPKVGHRPA